MSLHKERLEELREAFDMYANVEGFVDEDVVIEALRLIGVNPSIRDVEEAILDLSEKKRPGCVSFDNFVDLTLKEWGELKSEDLLREAFRVFDISNTGTLSYEQMVHILTNIGDEAITISDAEEFLSSIKVEKGAENVNYLDAITLINSV